MFRIKYFGTLSGIFAGVLLIIISFVFRIPIIYNSEIGKIPYYFWIIFIIFNIGFLSFDKKTNLINKNKIYFIIAIISFIYLTSMFQWSTDCCPKDYDSMYDWNASKGIAWIIYIPVTFVIIIIQGFIYDYFIRKSFRKEILN